MNKITINLFFRIYAIDRNYGNVVRRITTNDLRKLNTFIYKFSKKYRIFVYPFYQEEEYRDLMV